MKRVKKKTWLVGGVVLVVLIGWLAWPDGSPAKKTPQTLMERAAASVELLKRSDSQAGTKIALEDLKRVVRQMDATEARDWIVKQIQFTDDLPTDLNVTLGADQNLTSWSSYHLFLIDMLGLVDPAVAAAMARDLLPLNDLTMDEFAIALRNLVRGSTAPEDLELVKASTAQMLKNEDWLANPSTGFLEGFDIIVATQNTALVPALLAMTENPDAEKLRQAAFLTVDRLMLAKPREVLPQLDQHAAMHPHSRLMISNMVARADVRDAVQRRAVEDYLLNENRSPDELRGFATTFPNATMAVSRNLITRQSAIPADELMKRDRAALDVVAAWLSDPRLERVHGVLRETYQRLSSFVRP